MSIPNLSPARSVALRYFYSVASILMLALAIIGFRHFYLQGQSYPGRPITPPIRGLIILHSIAMSAWIVLSIVQPLLIASRRHRNHRTLGRIGAVLAAVVLILGLMVATRSTAVVPLDETFGELTARQFLALTYTSILMFGLYVAIGVWQRRRQDIHKPMMFLGTLSAMSAPLDRIDAVRELHSSTVLNTIWGPFVSTLALGAVLFIVRCALARSLDRWFAVGLAGLFLAYGVMVQVATTPAWDWFASLMVP